MNLHTGVAGDPQLHAPGQCGLRTEGFTIDKVGPAADDLPQQQAHHRQIAHGEEGDLMALRVDQRHDHAHDHRTVNGKAAVPDPHHGAPVQAAVRLAVKIQIKEDIVQPGTDDAAGHRPEHHVHHIVFGQAVMLGLLHAQVQSRQHGDSQNNPVPVDSVAHMNGHRVNVQLPVPKQAREADGHIFHCDHNRFFLSAAGAFPRCICFRAREAAFLGFPQRQVFGTMRLTAIRSGVTLAFRNDATSSGVMESNTSGNLKGS